MNQSYNTNIVVVGAGTAGTVCALAAAKLGLKTILVEQTGLVGGVAATALMGSFANLFVNTKGEKMTDGIICDILKRMVEAHATPYNTLDEAINGTINKPFTIPFQPVLYTQVLSEMLEEYGVQLLLNTMFTGGENCDDNTKLLMFSAGTQRVTIKSTIVVDASGNAQVAAALNAETMHNFSTHGCLMRIANVDISQTFEYIKNAKPWVIDDTFEPWLRQKLNVAPNEPIKRCKHLLDPLSYDHAPMKNKEDRFLTPERFEYIENRWQKEGIFYTLELCLLRQLLRDAANNNDLLLDKALGANQGVTFNGDGIAYGGWGKGIALCNVSTAYGFDPDDIEQNTKATLEIRKYNVAMFNFFKKYVPGFSNSTLLDMGSQAVARVGQTIVGCDEEKLYEQNSLYAQPIYMFGGIYAHQQGIGVPYGKIVSKNIPNIFAVGKCSSHGGQYRSQISCMSMGVAAAAAANVIITNHCDSHTISKNKLEQQLKEMNVVLPKGEQNNA